MSKVPGVVGPFQITKTLGLSSTGAVYVGQHVQTLELVAIKAVDLALLSNEGKLQLDIEINVLRELYDRSPFIIRLYDVIREANTVYLIEEYCPHGDLYEFVAASSDAKPLDESLVRSLFRQTVAAVAELHTLGIVHHDLKLENVLLAGESATPRWLTPSIRAHTNNTSNANFTPHFTTGTNSTATSAASSALLSSASHSAVYNSSTELQHSLNSTVSIKLIDFNYCCRVVDGGLLDKFRGTESYLAPEILEGFPYDGKLVDSWCLGIMLFIMVFKRFPFDPDNLDSMYQQATSRVYLASLLRRLGAVPQLGELLTLILEPNPFNRVSVAGILQHPWLQLRYDANTTPEASADRALPRSAN
jgi:serine/threonine protein kinase